MNTNPEPTSMQISVTSSTLTCPVQEGGYDMDGVWVSPYDCLFSAGDIATMQSHLLKHGKSLPDAKLIAEKLFSDCDHVACPDCGCH